MTLAPDGHVYFFLRVPRTGSTTFVHYMRQVLGRKSIYPGLNDPQLTSVLDLDLLREAVRSRGSQLRGYEGHFPAFAADLVGATRSIAVLRHPVARTLSLLKIERQITGRQLEEIYADRFSFETLIRDHQTKLFSLGEHDRARSYLSVIPIDRSRLDLAKERLSTFDIVGLQEEYQATLEAVRERWGWPRLSTPGRLMYTQDAEVPPGLAERIAEDNRWDIELYEWAAERVAVRGAASPPPTADRLSRRFTKRYVAALRYQREGRTPGRWRVRRPRRLKAI